MALALPQGLCTHCALCLETLLRLPWSLTSQLRWHFLWEVFWGPRAPCPPWLPVYLPPWAPDHAPHHWAVSLPRWGWPCCCAPLPSAPRPGLRSFSAAWWRSRWGAKPSLLSIPSSELGKLAPGWDPVPRVSPGTWNQCGWGTVLLTGSWRAQPRPGAQAGKHQGELCREPRNRGLFMSPRTGGTGQEVGWWPSAEADREGALKRKG